MCQFRVEQCGEPLLIVVSGTWVASTEYFADGCLENGGLHSAQLFVIEQRPFIG